jgi:hypothetical protein
MSGPAERLTSLRRKVGENLATAGALRSDEAARLEFLQRAIEVQREVVKLDAEITAARPPCRMCGRKVVSPCNDAEGYYEGGPWDSACETYARGGARP